ncbi:LLM class flavin-dependent oxidoreductase [Sphaerobacter thermophilus]|uniref:Luciferase-like monooxygenase n=1 Tax=Sphaerobacter thermophilus (strain ATCC 49802 / DSM 20745 / KCCM 41009 / NCIMB 13125 / S 6022) TaxID=479434 RepID=D1C8W9_SPHTD|nr:LLM class flavin-dependent oxidoreductase [Sphaerobacter thermophilus]ACZ40262.1 luciferase family oxidoreductase, group 1 [Sphaerobacter thermophilus DSM 20745]
MSLPLSFLDLCQIESGSTSATALRNAVELAQVAERLGYTRYWFAEHHNTIGLASGSPEIMIAHVAAHTRTIRVGAGGVMLPNHAPLRVAEAFRLLEALHPGRIDLGLGRAPGTDTLTAFALRRSEEALRVDQYPQLLAELLAFDGRSFPEDHPFRAIEVTPADVRLPPIWLLGSSAFSAQLAAEVGLAYSFAAHINFGAAIPAMRMYRERFQPSEYRQSPHAILAVGVVVGETNEHARELLKIVEIGMAALAAGRPSRMPTFEEAQRIELSPLDLQRAQPLLQNVIFGDAETVAGRMRELAEESQADEIMVTTFLPNQADRLRAVEQLARVWGLQPEA